LLGNDRRKEDFQRGIPNLFDEFRRSISSDQHAGSRQANIDDVQEIQAGMLTGKMEIGEVVVAGINLTRIVQRAPNSACIFPFVGFGVRVRAERFGFGNRAYAPSAEFVIFRGAFYLRADSA
jgi:hypothetical protein